jgi:SAM-dependent methyltransferase
MIHQEAPAGSVRTLRTKAIPTTTRDLAIELISRVGGESRNRLLHDDMRLLGNLWAHLDVHMQVLPNRFSVRKSMLAYWMVRAHPDFKDSWLLGKTCLEFGSGGLNPGGSLFVFLLAGAARAIAMDLDDIESPQAATKALYHVLCAAMTKTCRPVIPGDPTEILARVSSFDVDKLAEGDMSGVDLERLRYLQQPITEAGLPEASVDLLFSNSVLEHIPDVDEVLAEIARVMAPGALGVHAIDGVDHRTYGNPNVHALEFLREDRDVSLLHGCNRIRPLDFVERFERHGLEVRSIAAPETIELDDATIASFAPAYRSRPRDVLETTRARFYLRKRG